MQEEITVGMNDLVSQGFRNGKHSSVNDSSGGGCRNRRHVAIGASDMLKDDLPLMSGGSHGENRVTRWHHRSANELGEVVDIRQSQGVGLIFGICGCLADCGHVLRAQTIGNSHLVHVSVGDEREQAAMLVFPTKSSYPGLTRSFKNWGLNSFPMNQAVALLRLARGDG